MRVVPDDIDAESRAVLEACDTISLQMYRLRNASRLPDDFDSAHVFRGAEYVPEDPAA